MDHLHGLGILFASETVTATHTVARSALDIAIAPWFLLEPGIEARERIRRYMNLRLLRLKEQTMIAPGDSKDPAAERFRQHAPRLVDRIARTARNHGFTVKTSKSRYKPVHLTPDMPSTTMLAQEIVDPGGSSLGSMMWRINSTVAHGQLHGLGLFLVLCLERFTGLVSTSSVLPWTITVLLTVSRRWTRSPGPLSGFRSWTG
jgi:hypothetical protein